MMSGTRFREDWQPSLINFLFQAVTVATTFYLPIFLRDDLRFSGAEIGLLYALSSVAGVLAALPAGLSNDRLSSRTLIVFALVLQSVCVWLLGEIEFFAAYTVLFFIWALSSNLYKVSLDVQVMKTESAIGLTQRVYLYQALRFIGLMVGVIPAGYLLARFDFRLTLSGIAVIILALALYSLRLKPTPIATAKLSDYAADLSRPRVLAFALWLFLFAMHWGAEATSYGLFLRTNLGLDRMQMGAYLACEYSSLAFLFVLLYRRKKVFDGAGLRRVAIFGLLGSGLGHICMIVPIVWLSAFFRMVHGFGDGLMFVIFYLGIARLFDMDRVGGNTGFINLCTMLGMVAGSLLSGFAGERFGYTLPLWVSGALTLLLILPLLGRRQKALVRI